MTSKGCVPIHLDFWFKWDANVTISSGEFTPTCHYMHPIHIMSYDIGLVPENIALEIITGGVSTANIMISSDNFWPKCLCTHHHFGVISVYFYLILANMTLEIITVCDSSANVTISRGELIPTCHCVHPIYIMSYDIGLILENIALEIITVGVSTANVTISSDTFWPKCLCTRPFHVI